MSGPGAAAFDLIVVGGGCNGTGIARDAALRGHRVALLEKGDFGHGATGNSSGMIHGGPRYLTADRDVTRLSCEDSGIIQRLAPHLCFRIPFLAPVLRYPKAPWATTLWRTVVEVFLEAYDVYQPLKNGKVHTRLSEAEARAVEPGLGPDVAGALTFDEWGIDTHRLCVLNAVSAARAGAVVKNHCGVEAVLREGGEVVGVRARDMLTGEGYELRARAVYNATGAWSPRFAAMAGAEVRLRPGKGIHLVYDRRLSDYGLVTTAVDGRELLMIPHEHHTIIGTTDDDYYGDPEDVAANFDEKEYLLQAFARVFPSVRQHRIVATWAGVRPTLWKYGPAESKLSRAHRVLDHAPQGAAGLYSIVGGKLAAYRIMSEEAVDAAEGRIGRKGPCRTREDPLPGAMAREGGEMEALAGALAERFGVDRYAVTRLVFRHGTGAEAVLELGAQTPRGLEVVDAAEPVLECEVRHCVRHEWARTLPDLTRRCLLGAGGERGVRAALRAGEILAEELGVGPAEARAAARALLDHGWRDRAQVLDGIQLAQEELNLARAALVWNLGAVR
ncbi:MAG TPA: glycerol-3-phosphate dehydrogenase/oxidase [Myxococcota bacterium]|jgi:glycerol-3-phosphate dehydrogenase|nr:glycerol-3-phosphate dehydrogenase/oxidase [Myxococcota bacterium]